MIQTSKWTILGLDPAQPGFEGTPAEVRLDPSDAEEVDVIHTDAKPFIPFFGFGIMAPVGMIQIITVTFLILKYFPN